MMFLSRVWEFCLWATASRDLLGQTPLGPHDNGLLPGSRIHGQPHLTDSGCVNSPQHRDCWYGTYNISTDYELVVPDTGKTVYYDLEITNQYITPDGYNVSGMVINGQYPGPKIEADWGDTLSITVHNNLKNLNGTSIHWHGIRQFMTNWQDGVAGVTQCPIPPGESYTYVWRARQYGVSWYHSHFSLQYPDGIAGPLKINGPTTLNYDEDIGPVLITDWYHADAFSLYHLELAGTLPTPSSNLINGTGFYPCNPNADPNCTGEQNRYAISFVKGKTYKLSIINTSTATHMTFWIDGHNFTVVGTDFVPITGYPTSTINVAIGQRYDIIVTANASFEHGTNFWINARDCNQVSQSSPLGIIRYDNSSTDLPYTPAPSRLDYGCLDEPSASMTPVVPRTVGSEAANKYLEEELFAARQGYPNTSDPNSVLKKWILANSSLYLDWETPSLDLISKGEQFPDSYAPIVLDYEDKEWVYFLIQGNFSDTSNRLAAPVAHPIHLHGHDFVILAQSNTTFEANDTLSLNLENPTRRDVLMLPVNGYVIIAFQVDNPGSWLMHCHIAWHASSGLALQYIEQPSKIGPLLQQNNVLPTFDSQCAKWAQHYEINIKSNATQEDSGI